jgi:hypothetical protein
MTVADWALVVSLFSVCVALASLVWNVWSKFIYPKSKVQVSISAITVVQGQRVIGQGIALSATNHGPIPIVLKNALLKMKRKRLKSQGWGLLQPWHNFPTLPMLSVGPFGGGLPKKLEVGEDFSVHFPHDAEAIASDDYSKIGFVDSFGKYHWARRSAMLETRAEAKKRPAEARPAGSK